MQRFKHRGQTLLNSVEALKKAKKSSYQEQVLAFETQDIDPLVWKQVLQAQKDTKAQVNGLIRAGKAIKKAGTYLGG